jgi:tetratricopeptide (TPR) repeat protein
MKYTRLLADAYYETALADTNMRKTTEALEVIRAAINEKLDYLLVWDALDRQIGKAEDKAVQAALVKLRERFAQDVYKSEIARLHKIFRKSPRQGQLQWLRAFSTAFVNSRLLLCKALAEEDFPFPEQYGSQVASLRQAIYYVQQNLFIEAYEAYIYLADQDDLPLDERISNLVDAAKIQLYIAFNLDKAKELLERATALAPDHSPVKAAWGLYWWLQGKYQEALPLLHEAIKLDRNLIDNYLLMGDYFEALRKFNEAEVWYNRSIEVHGGKSWGYIRLVRLYGHNELFESHRDQLQALLERANHVDPESVYANFLDMGFAYQQNGQGDEANRWYNRAIELKTSWVNGYINVGNAALEKEEFQQAAEEYQKVIAIAPEIFEGYWNMGRMYEQQGRWHDALSWYDQAAPLCKEVEASIRAKVGKMRLKLKQYNEAEKLLFELLQQDPGNQEAVNTLESLANEYYEKNKDLSAALRVYDTTRDIKERSRGQSYEVIYHNLVGNAYYYFGNYQAAIDEYARAVELSPADDVLRSNIARAWENLKQPGKRRDEMKVAIKELRIAQNLNPENREYKSRLENLEIQQKLVEKLGESALKLAPSEKVLEVGVAPDLLSYLVDDKTATGKVSNQLQQLVDAMRARIGQQFGLVMPGINFKDAPGAEPGTYFLTITDVLMETGRVPQGRRFLPVAADKLPLPLQTEVIEGVNPQTGERGYWVDERNWLSATTTGSDGLAELTPWQIMEYPLRHFEALLRGYLLELVDQQQVIWLLDPLKTPVAEKIKKSPEKRISFMHVLRALLEEGIPLTALDVICKTFIEGKEGGRDLRAIVEDVRSQPEILPILPGNNEQYSFLQLSPDLEDELAGFLHRESLQPLLVMNVEKWLQVVNTINEQVSSQSRAALVVANAELRPFVRKLIQNFHPQIPVLSARELLPGLESKILAKKESARYA